ncbi:L-histidine N(alpha)-methyltransferase [soil metagenome]
MVTTDIQFADVAQAVKDGFSRKPKQLPSWLFYDETGDKIFQAIMRLPEYYLTACEYEILQTQKEKLLKHFSESNAPFKLIELGAGDGLKTEILLRHFMQSKSDFVYSPIDVSESVLIQLSKRLDSMLPELVVEPIAKKYLDAIEDIANDEVRKVFLLLGANIGNFTVTESETFISSIAQSMHTGDMFLIGFDLKKDPRLILAAYDDPQGITRDFNMNLLVRLNRELGTQFQRDQFTHYPYYDPESGITKSYLVSLVDQNVFLEASDKHVHFDRWEVIHTEVSQKYDIKMIETLAEKSGLQIAEIFYDSKHYFCDVLLRK